MSERRLFRLDTADGLERNEGQECCKRSRSSVNWVVLMDQFRDREQQILSEMFNGYL